MTDDPETSTLDVEDVPVVVDLDLDEQEPPRASSSTTAMVRVAAELASTLCVRRGQGRSPFEHVIPEPLDPRLVLLADPDSRRADAFRLLVDTLLAKDLPQVVAVSSARRGEGKTTCAMNLALALAERSVGDVLLVDGNLVEPSLAQVFAIDEQTPVAPWTSPRWLSPYRIVDIEGRLRVAAIVPPADEPHPRLEARWFAVVLRQLAEATNGYVVVDTPALECTFTVRQLLATTGGVVVAARGGRTTTRSLRSAVTAIGASRTLGVALVDAK
jgi:Mrp family chromosome partitioning ATPase